MRNRFQSINLRKIIVESVAKAICDKFYSTDVALMDNN